MKKMVSLLCAVALAVVMVGCSSDSVEQTAKNTQQSQQTTETLEQTQPETANAAPTQQESAQEEAEKPAQGQTEEQEEPEDKEEAQTEQTAAQPALSETQTTSSVLVAYFSATGNTRAIAESAADLLGADLYEIVPAEPYTDADLDYNDSSSRTSVEMNDPTARPAISNTVENMAQYDTILLGYPIWWGQAPRIIDTFLESYDFSGKTIVPFCTSGGSGVGESADQLHALTADGVNWLDGTRLATGSSQEEVGSWIDSLGLDAQ